MSEHVCTCEHPKQEPGYFCGPNCGPGNDIRHPKWQRVEPGTVIPAGQPYRCEGDAQEGMTAVERVSDLPVPVIPNEFGSVYWFVDSSWKPPLVLPTEPTWGIAVFGSISRLRLGRWAKDPVAAEMFLEHSGYWAKQPTEQVLDFIPLTDEQVARIEAAR